MDKFFSNLVAFVVLLANLGHVYPAKESMASTQLKVGSILQIVERLEEQLAKEDRLRSITDIVRIDSNIDRLNKKMDRLIALMEDGTSSRGASMSGAMTEVSGHHVSSRLHLIDDRLQKLEESINRISDDDVGVKKLEEIDRRTVQLKDDLNQKLRKMMNVITALYEMNKEMKTNFGGRSEAPQAKPESSASHAAEFLIENLEELERKIKEQFSVLTNEVRTEITGLKIVASSISGRCTKIFDDYEEEEESTTPTSARSGSKKAPRSSREKDDGMTNTLDSLVQTLSRSTREIREEIHLGMQTLDDKLSNITNGQQQQRCPDDIQASASMLSPAWTDQRKEPPSQQNVLDKDRKGKHESCSRNAEHLLTPRSCAELLKGGANCDGVYVIFPKNVRAVRVYCDMTTDGGGWTVLMRRGDFGSKMTTFHKNWLSYKNGFGDVEGEFWLGNDVLNLVTSQDDNILRVHLEAFDGDNVDLTYSSFNVGNESQSYRMHIGPSMGPPTTASNSLRYHNNHPFSTFDKKNDPFEQNCAATYRGGWWFNGCYFGFLTGEYFKPEDERENWQGILWYDWKGNAALKGAKMMVRPKTLP